MNNNNRGNNRRRGRGNNRPQGGQQTNRIDSRARGNAPQLLEKYRKLAHDAHLNGDRVTEEYNLQFADHYFRVMADQKQRQEESRQPQPRRDDYRQPDYGDDYGSYDDPYGEAASAPAERAPRAEREPRPERESRPEREPRAEREPRFEQRAAEPVAEATADAGQDAPEGDRTLYEPVENPFVRDNRASRGLKQRKPRGSRSGAEGAGDEQAAGEDAPSPAPQGGADNFDAAVLPPAISPKPARKRAAKPVAAATEAPADAAANPAAEPVAEEKPRRRRTRKADPDAGSDQAAPEAVNG